MPCLGVAAGMGAGGAPGVSAVVSVPAGAGLALLAPLVLAVAQRAAGAVPSGEVDPYLARLLHGYLLTFWYWQLRAVPRRTWAPVSRRDSAPARVRGALVRFMCRSSVRMPTRTRTSSVST